MQIRILIAGLTILLTTESIARAGMPSPLPVEPARYCA